MGKRCAQDRVHQGHQRGERGVQSQDAKMACARCDTVCDTRLVPIQFVARYFLRRDLCPFPRVSPIEPAHSPFKNIDALACPGGRHWVFGDKISRSEESRVGKSVSVRVDLGGRRTIKKKKEGRAQRKITTIVIML